jgi:hypothetical protein
MSQKLLEANNDESNPTMQHKEKTPETKNPFEILGETSTCRERILDSKPNQPIIKESISIPSSHSSD